MIKNYKNISPEIANGVFVAENASVIGSVKIGKGCSVWYGAVIRADSDSIVIGENTNIQDNCTVHTAFDYGVKIGNGVTVGHNAVVHGCTVGDNTLIGMNSTILNGAVIGNNSIVGAGALVTEHKQFPDNSLIIGVPAKAVATLDDEAVEKIRQNGIEYTAFAKDYLE